MKVAQDSADIILPQNAKVCMTSTIRVCIKAYNVTLFTEPSEFKFLSLYAKSSKLATVIINVPIMIVSMDIKL